MDFPPLLLHYLSNAENNRPKATEELLCSLSNNTYLRTKGSNEPLYSFRLKSKRRKKRLHKEDHEKKLLALHREDKKLGQQIRNLGYEPLTPPIQKGWKRIFVLREDVKRSSLADFYQGLLKKINTTQYSDTKVFRTRKRRWGRKIYLPKEQKVRHFYEYEWQKKPLTEAEAVCFTEHLVMTRSGTYQKVYECSEPWRFVLKVVPNMITEIRITDSLLEQRQDEISNYLERNHLRPKLNKLLGSSYHHRWYYNDSNPKYTNSLANKPLHIILQELQEE
jgi:hypothetical protein